MTSPPDSNPDGGVLHKMVRHRNDQLPSTKHLSSVLQLLHLSQCLPRACLFGPQKNMLPLSHPSRRIYTTHLSLSVKHNYYRPLFQIPLFDVLCLGVSGAGKSTLMRAASAPVDVRLVNLQLVAFCFLMPL